MEKKSKSTVWKVLLAIVVISVVGIGTALVEEDKVSDNVGTCILEPTWPPPTTGSPVHHYVAQVKIITKDNVEDPRVIDPVPNDLSLDPQPNNWLSLTVECGSRVWIRVRGIGADGCEGPWSVWSLEKYAEKPVPKP